MGKKYSKKVHQESLREEWAKSLLAQKDPNSGGSLYDALQAKIRDLDEYVRRCQQSLADNPLTSVVAEAAAREAGRGGKSTIVVNEQGTILLEVTPKTTGEKRGWKTTLPPIKELRAEAARMKLDISAHGRSRRDIHAAILAAKAEAKPAVKKAKKKMFKTGDAITTPRVVDTADLPYDEATELPDDLLDDTPSPSAPDLSAVVVDSEDLDLDAILDTKAD